MKEEKIICMNHVGFRRFKNWREAIKHVRKTHHWISDDKEIGDC
jgi:hypothetical protein